MKLYYRISDQSYPKQKLMGTTKEFCLANFCLVFEKQIFCADPNIRVIADRCSRSTLKMLRNTGLPLTMTDLGNAGSFRKALELALLEDPDEVVYFCEDDYLHLKNAPTLLEEGIRRAHYVSLFDHPDKYTRYYNLGETSKVIRTPSSHWRFTISTCMTFGSLVKNLDKDKEIWLKHTSEDHPNDHDIFTELSEQERRLAVCIPGAACHTDLSLHLNLQKMMVEPWAIEMAIDKISSELPTDVVSLKEEMTRDKMGWEKLLALDALKNLVKG